MTVDAVLTGAQLWHVEQADCVEAMRALPENSVDAICTDPPYLLGFMGRAWDGQGVHLDPPAMQAWHARWATEALRVLKPGAYLLSTGGSRTFHRMACAIEDAGFEIRDMLMWLTGQGFPKSLNLDGEHEGWGTALKPGWEAIALARKPLAGTVAENMRKWGTGALHVDACRLRGPVGNGVWGSSNEGAEGQRTFNGSPGAAEYRSEQHHLGRWPSNVLLTHDERCELRGRDCSPACPVGMLDEQAGPRRAGGQPKRRGSYKFRNIFQKWDGAQEEGEVSAGQGPSTGSASRFFYCAKASRSERDAGCEALPQVSAAERTGRADGSPGLVMEGGKANPYAGNSSDNAGAPRNHHSTVKPIDLMRWLVRLVTPPGGLVLDPFAGSGSTGIAVVLEGARFVGVEREEAYVRIARARIAHWERHGAKARVVAAAARAPTRVAYWAKAGRVKELSEHPLLPAKPPRISLRDFGGG